MMSTRLAELPIISKEDIVEARKHVSTFASSLGMSSMKETELRTAVTELLTNAIRYAGGGKLFLDRIEYKDLAGIRAIVDDEGPGIADVEAALSKGFSTGKSLGHGLSGCKNLVDSFDFQSELGKGTRVVISKWC